MCRAAAGTAHTSLPSVLRKATPIRQRKGSLAAAIGAATPHTPPPSPGTASCLEQCRRSLHKAHARARYRQHGSAVPDEPTRQASLPRRTPRKWPLQSLWAAPRPPRGAGTTPHTPAPPPAHHDCARRHAPRPGLAPPQQLACPPPMRLTCRRACTTEERHTCSAPLPPLPHHPKWGLR